MNNVTLHRGSAPLLISLPHDGSAIPSDIATRMCVAARASPDTDWHVGQLYDFARELGASVLKPRWSRYVIDLNRPADGHAMYPGHTETGLVPLRMFNGDLIYLDGEEPDATDIASRVQRYWQPYHQALAQELERLRTHFGSVALWEGHSIRSEVPMFFEGRLPDFNLGTADGASCTPGLQHRLIRVLEGKQQYSHVANARFKGGYITRHYGQPERGVDAVQLELAQVNYMDEDSFDYQPLRAAKVQTVVRELLQACLPRTQ